ncbi:hypothetical protein VTN96DRAFT_1640 [Rasamsonia emersonii]
MTQDLPAGLVTTTGKIGSELDGLGDIAIEDIAKLWRVYTTHSSVQRDGAASRLENLFWRIWGSTRLRKTLTGSTLAALFMDISEDRPLRTTPRQSPQAALKKTSRISPETLNNPSVSNYSDAENVPSAALSVQTRTPLPSILKKPHAEKPCATPGEPSSFKTTRILVPEIAVQKAKTTLTPAMGAPATVTAATSRDPPQKAGRKKPTFVANTSALSKRRPVVIRRKSSQTSPSAEVSEGSLLKSEAAAATTKADGPAQKPAIPEEQDNSAQGLSWQSLSYLRPDDGNNTNNQTTSSSPAPNTTTTTTRLSPPPIGFTTSSVHRHASPVRPPSTEQAATQPPSSSTSKTSSLVDPDFRSRFAERRRQEAAAAAATTTTTSDASSCATNPSSSSYLGNLLATSNIGKAAPPPRRASRSLSPATTRHLIMPPPQPPSESTDPAKYPTTRPSSSSSRGSSSNNRRGRRGSSSSLLSLSSLRSGGGEQQQQQQNRSSYEVTSVQNAFASGEFTLPKLSSNHLSAIIERARKKSPNRS